MGQVRQLPVGSYRFAEKSLLHPCDARLAQQLLQSRPALAGEILCGEEAWQRLRRGLDTRLVDRDEWREALRFAVAG
jgi:hypothetical protein